MFKVTDKGVVVRRMLTSVVVCGAGDFALQAGDCWAFPTAADVPATVAAHSEPVEDIAAAGRIQHFDAEDYARRTRPRPEPKAEPVPMDKPAVLALTGWTDQELRRAVASLGFPRAGAYRTDGSPLWEEAAVRRYVEAAAGVPAPVKSGGLGAWLR